MSLTSNLVLPRSAFNQRSAPEWFLKELKSIDWRLMVYWNHLRERWIVDRCIRGITETDIVGGIEHTHDSQCQRTNVLVVRGPNQEYHALGSDVIEWFRKNDVGSKYAKPEHLIGDLTAKQVASDEKMKADRRSNTRHATLDGKRQLLKMRDLAGKHDLEVNK